MSTPRRWSNSPYWDGVQSRAETPAESVARWAATFASADQLVDEIVAEGHWTPERGAARKALHASALEVMEDHLAPATPVDRYVMCEG